jgi:hypothetical protein
MIATALRPLTAPTLVLLSLGSFTGCDSRECSAQGTCGEDAWCSPDGVCLPLDDVMAGEREAAFAPVMGGGGVRGVDANGASERADDRVSLEVVSVELEGVVGRFEVEEDAERSFWVQGLSPGRNWRVEVWFQQAGQYEAGLFINVDELRLDQGPQRASAWVTSCSSPDATGAFAYDRSTQTEVTVTPAEDGGFAVELAETELPGADGPVAAQMRLRVVEPAP